jgi:hypothetical protein
MTHYATPNRAIYYIIVVRVVRAGKKAETRAGTSPPKTAAPTFKIKKLKKYIFLINKAFLPKYRLT